MKRTNERKMKSGPLTVAIEQLELEAQHLTARLEKVRTALATMRELFNLPTPARRGRKPSPASNGNGGDPSHAILEALKDGPMTPRALAEQAGLSVSGLRFRLKPLEASGAVISSGKTADRRIALAGAPAKEAPQRVGGRSRGSGEARAH